MMEEQGIQKGALAQAAAAGEQPQADTADTDTREQAGGLSIEQSFARLREILGQMENEQTSLEDSYRLYEEGVKLMKECNEKIDRVEKKVQQLNADGSTSDFAG